MTSVSRCNKTSSLFEQVDYSQKNKAFVVVVFKDMLMGHWIFCIICRSQLDLSACEIICPMSTTHSQQTIGHCCERILQLKTKLSFLPYNRWLDSTDRCFHELATYLPNKQPAVTARYLNCSPESSCVVDGIKNNLELMSNNWTNKDR